jgi:RNA polymerase sigma-70 factor, ECF subfamily
MDRANLKTTCLLYRAGFVSKNQFFEMIWHTRGKRISFYIKRLLLSEEQSYEDLFQEIMLKIYNSLDNYNHSFGIDSWLYKIARNHCIDYMRKKQPDDNAIEAETLPSPTGTPEQLYLTAELIDEIDDAVNRMTKEERELGFLRLYEKMKFSEISEITGENVNTLKTRMKKIKLKLQHELEDYSYE